jgi:5-methyltetrahydropteroyltriglutamate--homocysteine methyltransferase
MRVSNLGYPRLGRQRELKVALEKVFKGKMPASNLLAVGKAICEERWKRQVELGVDAVPVNDFSFFDHMIDMALVLGVIPKRFAGITDWLELTLAMARGTADAHPLAARKWFNTNYHFLVPELSRESLVEPRWEKLRFELDLSEQQAETKFHPVIVGPWTFAKLCQTEGMSFAESLDLLLPRYVDLLKDFKKRGCEYVQIDEPSLSHDMVREDLRTIRKAYEALAAGGCKIQLATYFGSPESWLTEVANLPVHGFHFDLLYWTTTPAWLKTRTFPRDKELSLGIVNGRNVWATPLWNRREEIHRIVELYDPAKISLAPTCSLLHLPLDRTLEKQWDSEFASWVSFADQRLEELAFLKRSLSGDRNVDTLLKQREAALSARAVSNRVHRPEVKQAVARIEAQAIARGTAPQAPRVPHPLKNTLPVLPTTTIGSFPQTSSLRKTRQEWKRGKITDEQYKKAINDEIEANIRAQEKVGLDVLVHGEPERGDMVEYFAESWDGVAISSQGWVQSLGSRCVKPPLIFGDVRRRSATTVSWFTHAQSLTEKPVKAIITGPLTVLNWSFVRDDQARQKTTYQIALALRDEALELEKAGARILQIDEAALREGMPMVHAQWNQYLRWAMEAFQTVSHAVSTKVQLHVHLCYSAFTDIAEVLPQLGADVLLVEAARGGDELLKRLKKNRYAGAVGAGIVDVHASQMPNVEACEKLIDEWLKIFPAKQLWINPDCGLKGLSQEDATVALQAMVTATQNVRARLR